MQWTSRLALYSPILDMFCEHCCSIGTGEPYFYVAGRIPTVDFLRTDKARAHDISLNASVFSNSNCNWNVALLQPR